MICKINKMEISGMSKCDYCNEEIEEGYLRDDIYVICEECIKELYTDEEYNSAYEKDEIFWTTFYE